MFPENVGMDILWIEAHMLSQLRPQAAGIEHGPRTHDLGRRQSRRPDEGIGQHVDRIAHHHIDRVGGYSDHLRHQALDDVDVPLRQVDAGLPRLTRRAYRHDHDIRIRDRIDIPIVNIHRRTQRRALMDIQGLSLGLILIDIHNHNFRSHSIHGQGIGYGCADIAGTQNADLFTHNGIAHFQKIHCPGLPWHFRIIVAHRRFVLQW